MYQQQQPCAWVAIGNVFDGMIGSKPCFVIAIQHAYEIKASLKGVGYYYDPDWWGYDYLARWPMRVWRRDYPLTDAGLRDQIAELRRLRVAGMQIKYIDTITAMVATNLVSSAAQDMLNAYRVTEGVRRQDDGTDLPIYLAIVGDDAIAIATLSVIAGAQYLDKKQCWSIPQRNIWPEEIMDIVLAARERAQEKL